MLFQRMLYSVPCLRCVSINRTFNTLNKFQLDRFKCFNRRNFNDQSIFNINTNVPKDVLLYKSTGDRTFKMISIFSIVQFGFWLTVADTYNALLNEKPKLDENSHPISWLDTLKSKGKLVTIGVPIGCLCMGKKFYVYKLLRTVKVQ